MSKLDDDLKIINELKRLIVHGVSAASPEILGSDEFGKNLMMALAFSMCAIHKNYHTDKETLLFFVSGIWDVMYGKDPQPEEPKKGKKPN